MTWSSPKFLRLDTPEMTRDMNPDNKRPNTTLGSQGKDRIGRIESLLGLFFESEVLQPAQIDVNGGFTSQAKTQRIEVEDQAIRLPILSPYAVKGRN
jgi:hypothetical protein